MRANETYKGLNEEPELSFSKEKQQENDRFDSAFWG